MMEHNEKQRDPTQLVKPRRPILLTLMFWVFVVWTILGWLRFFRSLTAYDVILTFLSPGLYWYLLLAGLVWGLLGLPVLWGLTKGARWAPPAVLTAAVFYPLSYWFERLFLWDDPNAQRNWPFLLLLTLLWLGLVFWALRSSRVKHFFMSDNQKGK